MQFSPEDKIRLVRFYNQLIAQYGLQSPKAVGWNDDHSRKFRYEILCRVGNLDKRSVLDIGCGFGDLYGYIKDQRKDAGYKGIDINLVMIDEARQKYPDADFELADFGEFPNEKFDFVLSSGALSFKIAGHKKIYFEYIRKMYELSRVAAAFNMLNCGHHIDDENFAAYSPSEIEEFCGSFANKVRVKKNYMWQDFTVYLHH